MNLCLLLSQAVLFVILITNLKINGVEAGHKVVSLGNWFGSVEKVNFKNVEGTENSPIAERSEPVIKKKKFKKRKKVLRKDIDWVPDDDSSETTKQIKRKRKRKGTKRNLVKTAIKEFNITDSEEHDKRRKPVDIIVHIKMND